jgi:ABC-type Fe3+/spermidine/putrescine transport system ATPase subunit
VSAPFLTLAHVTKRFGSRAAAVEDLSLDIPEGESVVVVGPSGSGKTTLLRLIAGLEVPDAGDIWLDGHQTSSAQRSLLPPHKRGIGFVFQDLALWPHLTVHENLDFVLGAVKMSTPDRRARAREVLSLVRIEQMSTRYPHELSGGEQQRVALARALVRRPRLLLLDEPLSSLDPELRSTLRGELARIQRATAVTTLYVTHDLEDAALADRVVEMRAGRILSVRQINSTDQPS